MTQPPAQLRKPKGVRPKGIADVVLCVDCTGSMSPCIEGVKTHVQQLVEGLNSQPNLELDWRVRLVEYRDLVEGEPILERPFTQSIPQFQAAVRELRATGGGSEPESTLDAIYRALKSEWRDDCNRCVVVFTDATCHVQMHPSSVEPGQARDVHEVINLCQQVRARIFLYAPSFPTYAELAAAPRVQYVPVDSARGLGGVDFGELMKAIGKTVSASTTPVLRV